MEMMLIFRFDGALQICLTVAATVVVFRELAVTSIRLVVSGKEGLVVAASWLGKIKTVLQVVCIVTVLLEPALALVIPFCEYYVLSYVTMIAMLVMTLWSGIDYLKSYWKFIDPTK